MAAAGGNPAAAPGRGAGAVGARRRCLSPASRGSGPWDSRLLSAQRTPDVSAAERRASHRLGHLVPKLKSQQGKQADTAPPGPLPGPPPSAGWSLPGVEAATAFEAEVRARRWLSSMSHGALSRVLGLGSGHGSEPPRGLRARADSSTAPAAAAAAAAGAARPREQQPRRPPNPCPQRGQGSQDASSAGWPQLPHL